VLLASDSRFKQVNLVDLVPGHMIVRADVNQLRQVLLNLLHNAAEAMPDGGRVELEAHFQLSGADGFNKAPAAVITVTDNGFGIDAETAAHLFEPFWTTKPDGSGLGAGNHLSNHRGPRRNHSGRISAGRGLSFHDLAADLNRGHPLSR